MPASWFDAYDALNDATWLWWYELGRFVRLCWGVGS
jgi:hypothetical protein